MPDPFPSHVDLIRRGSRRITGLLLALALSVGMLSAAASTAHADPDRPLTVVDWDITGLENGGQGQHDRYWNMIDRMHRISGHDFYRVLDETTTTHNQLIQVRVNHAGRHVVSLYFWANTLYLAGFYQPGQANGTGNRHYVFPDGYVDAFNGVLGVRAETLPWNGSYANLPNGGLRDQRRLSPQNLQNALLTLGNAQQLLGSGHGQHTVGSYLVDIIGATAEAARFGYLFDIVRGNIRNHTSNPIGRFGAALQTSWGQLSTWVYARLNDPTGGGFTIGGAGYSRYYPTVAALIADLGYIELNGHKRRR
ncbi:ribosome-inactivating family protein [Streptomyces sp. HNM0645]|uniref:ribosome-inactivating family protein n=1 Tax=Streptomyces sp. HNM0645 TaxID=2782343 RepID=UPI0024B833C7|nr:ribosome-inactivating family protein [Streptomyces sp. HNM0645]MDI9883714.1 ribosome-inactivating family protein [Streptomyces sp. HNM0645]